VQIIIFSLGANYFFPHDSGIESTKQIANYERHYSVLFNYFIFLYLIKIVDDYPNKIFLYLSFIFDNPCT
jgi:hypothetical protein